MIKKYILPSLLIFAIVSGAFLALSSLPQGAKAEPKTEPFATPEQMAAKDAAVTQCLMQQDVPVMGFGMKVVCVKKEHVSWIR